MSVKIEHRDGWAIKIHNDQLEMWEQSFGDDGHTAVIACWNRPTGGGTVDVLDSYGTPFSGTKTKGITDRELWEQMRDMAADIASRCDD